MKIKFLIGAAVILAFTFCSKEREEEIPADPPGTITLNMMNRENGETAIELEGFGVFLDNANNFYGGFAFMFANLGKKSGLGAVSGPEMSGLVDKVTVEPGHAYQIFFSPTKFPSGNYAISAEDGIYLNVYIDSWIKKDDEIIGAKVKYVKGEVPSYALPEYNSNVGTLTSVGQEIGIYLGTKDFEIDSGSSRVEYFRSFNSLIIKMIDGSPGPFEFGVYIRIEGSFTYIYGTLNP